MELIKSCRLRLPCRFDLLLQTNVVSHYYFKIEVSPWQPQGNLQTLKRSETWGKRPPPHQKAGYGPVPLYMWLVDVLDLCIFFDLHRCCPSIVSGAHKLTYVYLLCLLYDCILSVMAVLLFPFHFGYYLSTYTVGVQLRQAYASLATYHSIYALYTLILIFILFDNPCLCDIHRWRGRWQ